MPTFFQLNDIETKPNEYAIEDTSGGVPDRCVEEGSKTQVDKMNDASTFEAACDIGYSSRGI